MRKFASDAAGHWLPAVKGLRDYGNVSKDNGLKNYTGRFQFQAASKIAVFKEAGYMQLSA